MLAVVDHAANGNATEANAVIATLAPDQPGAGGIPLHPVIGKRDFQRRVDPFRTGACKEHMVKIIRR